MVPPPLSYGRARESERNLAEGAVDEGVMVKRLEVKTAPSGAFPVVGGTTLAMIELEGNAMQVYFSHDMKFAHCTDHNARHWRTYSS